MRLGDRARLGRGGDVEAPDHSEAYRSGWLDGRYDEPKPVLASLRLARWSSVPDRLDYYRGHRAGREARFVRGPLIEAS